MPSARRIAANRNNSKKSTGPRSVAGRQTSSRNALRHGLAIDIGTDPAMHDDIENLAKTLSLACGQRMISENAREAAKAELDLLRIRRIRASLFETFYISARTPILGQGKLDDHLAKLERYERRAFSRRKGALRAMYGESRIMFASPPVDERR
jgi:hypothetical protein